MHSRAISNVLLLYDRDSKVFFLLRERLLSRARFSGALRATLLLTFDRLARFLVPATDGGHEYGCGGFAMAADRLPNM